MHIQINCVTVEKTQVAPCNSTQFSGGGWDLKTLNATRVTGRPSWQVQQWESLFYSTQRVWKTCPLAQGVEGEKVVEFGLWRQQLLHGALKLQLHVHNLQPVPVCGGYKVVYIIHSFPPLWYVGSICTPLTDKYIKRNGKRWCFFFHKTTLNPTR